MQVAMNHLHFLWCTRRRTLHSFDYILLEQLQHNIYNPEDTV